MSNKTKHFKHFWNKYEQTILICLALILTGLAFFRAGQTYEQNKKNAQIEVSLSNLSACNPAQEKALALSKALESKSVNLSQNTNSDQKNNTSESNLQIAEEKQNNPENSKECTLIGSKNSNKYHRPNCIWAKKIKPENRVCFSSEDEAKSKGYQPANCCFK